MCSNKSLNVPITQTLKYITKLFILHYQLHKKSKIIEKPFILIQITREKNFCLEHYL